MSFFIQNLAREQARKAIGKPAGAVLRAAGSQAAKATLNRLGCAGCPLNKADVHTPKMRPTLAKEPGGIYFLAEAPGRDEDENSGRALTGPSGKLLRDCIDNNSLDLCSFDNTVRDRPPANRTPTWQEVESCRGYVTKSIEEAKPKLIVGLGGVPLSWMLGSTDLAGMRGRLFAVKVGSHACWFLPTYHPSFILRIAYDKKRPLKSKLGHCFRMDVVRAFDSLGMLHPPIILDEVRLRHGVSSYSGSAVDLDGVLALLRGAESAPLKAVDIETHRLRPYSKDARILTAAISHNSTNFSFAIDHPKAGWSKEQRAELLVAFKRLLIDDTLKVAHNAPFELEWFIWLFGKEVVNHAAWHCTQMQAHFLDERRGRQVRGNDDRRAAYQSLDFLFKQHFGLAYKHLFKLNKKNMEAADLSVMLTYNAVDTKATLMLHKAQCALLKSQGLYDAYVDALPRQCAVALMQALGVDVDQTEVKAVQKQLAQEIKQLHLKINGLGVVKDYISDNKEFNPQSDRDVLAVFKDYLKCQEVLVEAKGRYSVDKNVLAQIKHPLAPLIIRLRNRAKLKSTYCDGMELGVGDTIYPDGKLHTSFNTTFAETGRTSSDSPNLQNAPQRKDSWVRRQIVAPKNHVLVAFDYGQLEAATTAMCTKDRYLVKALWENYDTHMAWALKALEYCPEIRVNCDDPKAMKGFRSLIKNKLTFPAFFGAANESVCAYLMAALRIEISQRHVDDLMGAFWSTFEGVKAWQDQTMKRYYETGYVESPMGRRHRYPLTRNQVVNFPIQSFACDIVCQAMNRLSYAAISEGAWHLHPVLNIHDDISFIIPDDDEVLEEAIERIYKVMLTPSYQCVNVPLSVTCSIGHNWYEMNEVSKFFSHKDL